MPDTAIDPIPKQGKFRRALAAVGAWLQALDYTGFDYTLDRTERLERELAQLSYRRLSKPDYRGVPNRAPALTLTLTYAPARARMARPWSAGCYGVARHREGSRQNSRRAPACFLSGLSGGIPLSLGNVGAEEYGSA